MIYPQSQYFRSFVICVKLCKKSAAVRISGDPLACPFCIHLIV